MVYVQLTNGFGNNLFQYNAARLLATFLEQEITALPPSNDYYGIEEFKKIGIEVKSASLPNCQRVNDSNYKNFFDERFKETNLLVTGYFEDYTFFKDHIELMLSWYPAIRFRNENDLVLHARAGDRLFYANEFDSKPQAENYVNAIKQFDFEKLYIVTDMPEWKNITTEELENMNFHVNVPAQARITPEQSVDYFNSIVDGLAQFNPIHKKNSVADDFMFMRSFDKILFQHGTMAWWAAVLTTAYSPTIGVYGPWRPWKGASNKNLSDIGLKGWFKWT